MVARARKKRTRLKPEVRRAQLLDVGLEVFAKRGLVATSLDDVAAAAGVTKPLVYHHFENKQAFFDAIAEREMRLIAKRVQEASEAPSFEAALQRTTRSLFTYLEERPHGFGALMSHAPIAWQGDDRLSELRTAFYGEVTAAMEDMLAQAGETGTDPALMAHAMVGAFIFAAQHWLGDDSDTPPEDAADELATLIRDGVVGFVGKPPRRA